MDKQQVKEYKEMLAASPDTMESKIKAHLIDNCFKYDESKFEGCMTYLVNIAKEILDGKNGEVPDDVCYRICRDYFNDEIWAKEDEAKAAKEAKRKADKEKYGCKPAEPEKTCKADEEAKKVELEKMQAEAAREAEEKRINNKIRAQVAEINKELGIGMAQPIDMFAEAV